MVVAAVRVADGGGVAGGTDGNWPPAVLFADGEGDVGLCAIFQLDKDH